MATIIIFVYTIIPNHFPTYPVLYNKTQVYFLGHLILFCWKFWYLHRLNSVKWDLSRSFNPILILAVHSKLVDGLIWISTVMVGWIHPRWIKYFPLFCIIIELLDSMFFPNFIKVYWNACMWRGGISCRFYTWWC